ncbi:hypothetical protein D3C84_1149760 [compost metagenome]
MAAPASRPATITGRVLQANWRPPMKTISRPFTRLLLSTAKAMPWLATTGARSIRALRASDRVMASTSARPEISDTRYTPTSPR